MIRITDGSNQVSVTKGAYTQIYEPLGWYLLGSQEEKTADVVIEEPKEEIKFEEVAEEIKEVQNAISEEEELLEKPLSDMTADELQKYIEIMKFDVKKGLNKKETIEAIKEAMK